jgi:hypothetical protein
MRCLAVLLVASALGCSGSIDGAGGGGDDDVGGKIDATPGGNPDAGGDPDDPDASPPQPGATCKRGVAYNRENGADVPAFEQGIGWWYDWGPIPDGNAAAALTAAGVEFVPMVWTGPPRQDIDVDDLIAKIPAGSKYLLGFNEPNFGGQANLTPQQAADAWPLVEQIADARGLKIVSPALNYCGGNCNETDPFVWMDKFFELCQGCRVDYVAFHWYACTEGALDFIVGKFKKYGKPLWLTEFSCLDDADTSLPKQTAYMNDAIPLLENDPDVFRYSWFIGRSFPDVEPFNLFGNPGQLTALGESYVGFDGACAP